MGRSLPPRCQWLGSHTAAGPLGLAGTTSRTYIINTSVTVSTGGRGRKSWGAGALWPLVLKACAFGQFLANQRDALLARITSVKK